MKVKCAVRYVRRLVVVAMLASHDLCILLAGVVSGAGDRNMEVAGGGRDMVGARGSDGVCTDMR